MMYVEHAVVSNSNVSLYDVPYYVNVSVCLSVLSVYTQTGSLEGSTRCSQRYIPTEMY